MKTHELREDLAALSHEIWSHWMKYLFSCCVPQHEGEYDVGVLIPQEYVERWQRQMKSTYEELSEREKESDREQADKILKLLLNLENGHQYSRELMAVEKALTDPDIESAWSVEELLSRALMQFLAWAKMMERELG